MLTRLRNANIGGRTEALVPHSRLKSDVIRILKREGYIQDFKVRKDGTHSNILVTLKTGAEGRAITGLRRISTPGRRKYVGARDIPRVLGGMGTCVLSTSHGILTGAEAKKKNLGGEVICYAW